MNGLGATAELSDNWWLASGERILWEGAPDPATTFSKEDLFLVPFSIFWALFIESWAVSDYRTGWAFGEIFVAPFLLLGVYLSWALFLQALGTAVDPIRAHRPPSGHPSS